MRYFAIAVLILALAPLLFANAQSRTQAKIDSLEQVIAKANEDTTKARSLCSLCFQLRAAGQMDAALENGNAGLKLAREAGVLIIEPLPNFVNFLATNST